MSLIFYRQTKEGTISSTTRTKRHELKPEKNSSRGADSRNETLCSLAFDIRELLCHVYLLWCAIKLSVALWVWAELHLELWPWALLGDIREWRLTLCRYAECLRRWSLFTCSKFKGLCRESEYNVTADVSVWPVVITLTVKSLLLHVQDRAACVRNKTTDLKWSFL